MMRVKCELKPSSIHGVGCFAAQDIADNSVVWSYSPWIDHVITEREYLHAPPQEKQLILMRAYRPPHRMELWIYLGDEGQFLNFAPNGQPANLRVSGIVDGMDVLASAREIKAGEELTVPEDSDASFSLKMQQQRK